VPVQLPPIDDDVYAALQEHAVPLEDDINSVLRRLLARATPGGSSEPSEDYRERSPRVRSMGKSSPKKKRTRVPKGSILPESEYELPILRALEQMGGRGPTSEVIALLGEELNPKLTAVDRGKLTDGSVRWKNRAQFVRLTLVEQGDMVSGSPRGTWEISERGRKRVGDAG
jgi:hypothetical protein